jgi:hypothetical protein
MKYVAPMGIPDDYHDFPIAVAGASGALIGLLFVAVSVSPERVRRTTTHAEYHARASAAMLLFTNALVLSLMTLVPGSSPGWWALASGVGILVFDAAVTRSIVTAARHGLGHWSSLGIASALLAIAGFEIYAGIRLVTEPGNWDPLRTLYYVMIGDLAFGIARGWQLMNMRRISVFSSLRTLALGDEADNDADDPDEPAKD